MSAYLICDVTLKDRNKLKQYLELSEKTFKPFGGRFLAQAGTVDVVEGAWNPKVMVIAEFPSSDKARQWYHSADYAPALAVKPLAIDRNMIIVEGLSVNPQDA